METGTATQPPLPRFDVKLRPPDLARRTAGNTGIPGFHSFTADAAGPHVLLLAVVHGNEIAGAIALDRLLAAGLRPQRGRLSLGFVNLAAYAGCGTPPCWMGGAVRWNWTAPAKSAR